MTITFPRELPDVPYVTAEFVLDDPVRASPSGGRLINYTQIADPAWRATLVTKPLVYSQFAEVEAWWLSLREMKNVLFRHPHVCWPRNHSNDWWPARTTGRLTGVASGNVLSAVGVDPELSLSVGDRVGIEHANRWYVGRITEVSGSGTTRSITVEPPPPSSVAQVGAVVRFARPGLIMRPVPGSWSVQQTGGRYTVSFQLVEVAATGSVPRDFDLNFTTALAAAPYFTRASVGTYWGADGTLKTASANEPRVEYDRVTGEWLGLLMEEASQNVGLNSEFSDVSPQMVAPTGGNIGGGSLILSGSTGITGSWEIVSVATDSKGRKRCRVRANLTNPTQSTMFPRIRFAPEIPATAGQSWTGSGFVNVIASTLPMNYWLEASNPTTVSISGTQKPVVTGENDLLTTGIFPASGQTQLRFHMGPTLVAGASWTAEFEVACMQLEQKAFKTSYIPTAGSAVTRQADALVVSASAIGGFSEIGSAFCEIRVASILARTQTAWSIDDGTLNNRIALTATNQNIASVHQMLMQKDAGVTASINGATQIPVNVPVKFAAAFSADDMALSRNGVLQTRTSAAAVPTAVDRIRIGQRGQDHLNGHLRRFAYFQRRLSNADLQDLTA